jgi:hypothetical protein
MAYKPTPVSRPDSLSATLSSIEVKPQQPYRFSIAPMMDWTDSLKN